MIMVTGITGHSGTWFLQKLISEKKSIENLNFKAIVRKNSNTTLIDSSGLCIEKVHGDLNDLEFLINSFQDVDTVLHIAGIHCSLNIVKAAIKNDVRRLILVHTTGIFSKYKKAGKEYIDIEKQIQEMTKGLDMNITYLRPTMIYGKPSDNNMIIFIKMVDKLRFFPVVNHANYELQPVYAKDLGEAYYSVLINEESTRNKSYNLSGKEPILLIEVFKTIEKILDKEKDNIYFSVPFCLAYFGTWLFYLISLGSIDLREKVQRLVETRVFSHEDAMKDFGYSPISFEEGISYEIALYQEEK